MTDPIQHMSEGAKHLVDALSIGTLLGALFNMLPGIASLLTVLWMLIRIWETDTVRGLTGRKLTK